MTREEIKKELLTNEEQQFKTMVAAQFAVLYEYLVKKEVLQFYEPKEMLGCPLTTQQFYNSIDSARQSIIKEILQDLKQLKGNIYKLEIKSINAPSIVIATMIKNEIIGE